MKKLAIVALAAVLAMPLCAQNWKPLFNGKNLSCCGLLQVRRAEHIPLHQKDLR